LDVGLAPPFREIRGRRAASNDRFREKAAAPGEGNLREHLTVNVHYPAESGELMLRCERDWERNIRPDAVDPGRSRFEFNLELDAPFRYFKPVLVRGSETHWSLGENYLALRSGHDSVDVYPYFFSTGGCTACNLHHLSPAGSDREHAVRVFYPPGYHENPLESFPVIYMQDGQNLFFPDEAFGGHDWMIDETLEVLQAMNLVRRVVVVGVYPRDRMVDYTRPGYEDYGRFLVERVKPWIQENYRVLDGPRNTAVMGSSLGGVVSLYLAWQWPDVFGHAGCLSSTFGYRDDLAERISRETKRPIRIYLDSGWPGDNYEVTRDMRNLLAERGYTHGDDLLYLGFPRATHDERSWAMRAHIPFQHFFGETPGPRPASNRRARH